MAEENKQTPAAGETPEAAKPAAEQQAQPVQPAAQAEGEKPGATPDARKRHVKKMVTFAKVYIQASFNNTIITITDDRGNTLCWASAGGSGFKGTKKGTPFAAQMTASKVGRRAMELGVKQVAVYVTGPGPGRETAIRALESAGLHVISIKDVSPIPHNGCRAPKARRV
jgi:small subunit ribosomal protein S11